MSFHTKRCHVRISLPAIPHSLIKQFCTSVSGTTTMGGRAQTSMANEDAMFPIVPSSIPQIRNGRLPSQHDHLFTSFQKTNEQSYVKNLLHVPPLLQTHLHSAGKTANLASEGATPILLCGTVHLPSVLEDAILPKPSTATARLSVCAGGIPTSLCGTAHPSVPLHRWTVDTGAEPSREVSGVRLTRTSRTTRVTARYPRRPRLLPSLPLPHPR